ncbi:MAG: hypothetical protein ACD_46C00712G0006 [uncultured bacterium]|nr:MAG: hypothetical protein ACD_46C00712G0006 [uncultured bacterium]
MMDIGALKDCIGGLAKNVYFCGANENDQAPTVYARDANTRVQLNKLFRKKMIDNPEFGLIKIQTTRSLKLKQTRSLEEILTRVPHHSIYFDPTATIERAKILVCIAKQARQLLGSVLKGCYFNSDKRNIYFLVKANSTEALDLTVVRALLEPIILGNTQRLSHPFYYTITISLQKPLGSMVAVDKTSIVERNVKRIMKSLVNKLKWPLLVASATSSLGMTAAKAALPTVANQANTTSNVTSLPAVSKLNGWGGAAGDYLHNQRYSGLGALAEGGVAVPLTYQSGAQLHAVAGTNLQSIDGYIFWRNPAQGLLGPHVMYTKSSDFHDTLYGLHGESYLNSWTLTAEAGGASITNGHGSGNYYAEAIVNWYAQPDWRIYAGGIVLEGNGTGQVGTEYQLGLNSLPGLAVFADAGVGAHDLNFGFLGLRYYFGDCKSLVRRQREDMVLPTLNPIARAPSISHM